MRQAIHIFLKDARQFRYAIVVLVAWTILFAVDASNPSLGSWPFGSSIVVQLSAFLLPLSWWILIALVVQSEPLVGNQAFWLTRPYNRASLFTAKALFIVAFIVVPMALSQCMMLVERDLPLALHWSGLVWNQVLIGLVFLLPALAVASLTGTLTQFVLVGLGAAPVLAAFVYLPPWYGIEWVRTTLALVASVAAAGAVLMLQYRSRRHVLARGVGLSATAATLVVLWLLPWPVAFDLQARAREASDGGVGAELVHVDWPGTPTTGYRPLSLGIRLTGLDAEEVILCEGARFTIEGGEEPAWRQTAVPSPVRRTARDGCWFGVRPPAGFLERVKGPVATVGVELYVTLFGPPQRTVVPVDQGAVDVPGFGRCAATLPGYPATFPVEFRVPRMTCETGFRAPSRLVEFSSSERRPSYSPFPADLTFPVTERGSWMASSMASRTSAVDVSTSEPVAHLRVHTVARNVDLDDY